MIVNQPTDQTVVVGQSATFSVTATGENLVYQWKNNQTPIAGATSSTYTTPPSTLADDKTIFRVDVSNAVELSQVKLQMVCGRTAPNSNSHTHCHTNKATPPRIATPIPRHATPSPTPKGKGKGKNLSNVSTRVSVYKDDNVMIGGFIVSGETDKTVVLRAIGPSLVKVVSKEPSRSAPELYDSGGILVAQDN